MFGKEIAEVPVQTGDEIHFGPSTPDKVDTRTIYDTPQESEPDEEGNTYWYFPVYWEQDDEIAVYCPQASQPASQLVDYKITPDPDNRATSTAVTKLVMVLVCSGEAVTNIVLWLLSGKCCNGKRNRWTN